MRSNLAGLAIGVVTLLALWPLYDWVANLSQKQTGDSDGSSGTATTAGSTSDTAAGATVSGEAFYGDENDNTFIGTAGSDSLFGFAGNDSLTGAAGEDLLSGGTGNDRFTFSDGDSTQSAKAPSDSAFDVIKDWTSGSNAIDHTGGDIIVGGSSAAATASDASISAAGLATFDPDDDTLAERLAATEADLSLESGAEPREFAFFQHTDGNAYVFISDGSAGLTSGDTFIQLEGASSLSAATITDGDLFIA